MDLDDLRIERRRLRELKREKQRAANVGRAAKMHLARLDHKAVGAPSAESEQRFHVGCSGWFYWHWRGEFYPEDLPRNQWFDHYAQNFDTVELNAPFYSWPTLATVKTWITQAGDRDFVYTVKVSELITHVRKFVDTAELVLDFGLIADLLGPRMGCFLFQLPPSFTYTPERLAAIVGQLDPRRRNVVEFRHRSWWNEHVYSAFRENGTIFCSCSGPRLPDDLVETADEIYVRFHGTTRWYRHDYSDEELADWAGRIKASGAKQVWVYFNNDREGFAIKNAKALLEKLTKP